MALANEAYGRKDIKDEFKEEMNNSKLELETNLDAEELGPGSYGVVNTMPS